MGELGGFLLAILNSSKILVDLQKNLDDIFNRGYPEAELQTSFSLYNPSLATNTTGEISLGGPRATGRLEWKLFVKCVRCHNWVASGRLIRNLFSKISPRSDDQFRSRPD